MSEKISVVFTAKVPPYNAGDHAAFSQARASELIEANCARYADPAANRITVESRLKMARHELAESQKRAAEAEKAVQAKKEEVARLAREVERATGEAPESEEEPPEFYEDWTKKQLLNELGNRAIAHNPNAKKDILIELLVADDEADSNTGGETGTEGGTETESGAHTAAQGAEAESPGQGGEGQASETNDGGASAGTSDYVGNE